MKAARGRFIKYKLSSMPGWKDGGACSASRELFYGYQQVFAVCVGSMSLAKLFHHCEGAVRLVTQAGADLIRFS